MLMQIWLAQLTAWLIKASNFHIFSQYLGNLENAKATLCGDSNWNELPFLASLQGENLNKINSEIEDIQAKKIEVPIYNGDPNTAGI